MVYFSAAAHLSWPCSVYCPQAQVRRVQTRSSLLRERQKPHSQCRLTNRAAAKGSQLPAARVHTGEELGGAVWCKITEAQATELGRYRSGVVETARERGPKFRAPYSGYGPPAGGGLIPFKRVPHLRNLAVARAERQGRVRTGSGKGKNWPRASPDRKRKTGR